MRIITGSARGHKLQTPPGLDTRPTSETVKEAMMSAVQFEIEGSRVLDLFAGSGQLGLEALSRGASHCTFVDHQSACSKIIAANLTHTKLADKASVLTTDAAVWVRNTMETFDLAFVDPPYQQGVLPGVLASLVLRMTSGGAILCESSKEEQLPETVGDFQIKKQYLYGKRKVTLYRIPEQRSESE